MSRTSSSVFVVVIEGTGVTLTTEAWRPFTRLRLVVRQHKTGFCERRNTTIGGPANTHSQHSGRGGTMYAQDDTRQVGKGCKQGWQAH